MDSLGRRGSGCGRGNGGQRRRWFLGGARERARGGGEVLGRIERERVKTRFTRGMPLREKKSLFCFRSWERHRLRLCSVILRSFAREWSGRSTHFAACQNCTGCCSAPLRSYGAESFRTALKWANKSAKLNPLDSRCNILLLANKPSGKSFTSVV